jgi:L-alanine-DL-glutamate epimerase-like enolase superfamily enzyme
LERIIDRPRGIVTRTKRQDADHEDFGNRWPTWIPGYPQTHNNFTLIKITTDDGIEGYSAGPALGVEREGLGDLIGSYLLGADPTDIEGVQNLLNQAGILGWRNFWIEPACWDIIGKSVGKPVYEVLGGNARPIPAYCSTGEMHEPEHEVVRKGMGDDFGLGVDANQGWLVTIVDKIPAWDLTRATEFAKACHANDIGWLEEPLDSRDYDGNAALKAVSDVKISGAELNYGWDEIKIMFEKDCFDIYQPDAVFAGGIAQVLKVIEACHANKRGFSPHTWTNGIGFHIGWNMVLSDSGNACLWNIHWRNPRGCQNLERG